MPFRFPLQAVFHLRQSIEYQQELRLRAANQQVSKVRYSIDQVEEHIRKMRTQSSQQLIIGMTSAELCFGLTSETALQNTRRKLEKELVRIKTLRDQQQRIFEQARRERETLESLRNQQQHSYEIDQRRREQRRLDDLFLLRQAYRRRG
jgi:flagellar export protein FliJ